MKQRLKKIWNDPVGSKVLANLIWAIALVLGTTIFLFYQKIHFSIPIKESWDYLFAYLEKDRVIKNWDVFYMFLLVIILLVNRKIIVNVGKFIVKNMLSGKITEFNYNYHLTNQGNRTTGTIIGEMSFNNFKIKPQRNTNDWSLIIYFSHMYELQKTENIVNKEKVVIYKKINDNSLNIQSYGKENNLISKESKILMTEYVDQEFELNFVYSRDDGGIMMKVMRHGTELFAASVKFGCSYFIINIDENKYDFDLEINHDRRE